MENKIKFIKSVTNPEIAASAKIEIDLNDARATYGDNFNSIFVTNTDAASAINVYLDGKKAAYITPNNGVFSFDHEFKMEYNFLSIENTNAGAAIAADALKIFVGRSGAV